MKNKLHLSYKVLLNLLLAVMLLFSFGASAHAEENEPDLTAQYVYLYDPYTNQVLYEKNSTERMYPASMTKFMTAVVATEKLTDLDRRVTISSEMLAGLSTRGASVAGYSVGDEPTVKDLLYAMLLPSGADAANALAIASSGSLGGFAKEMNEMAARIGMEHSHFTSPHGLHDDDHYTTAEDLGKLLTFAQKNDLIREIIRTWKYEAGPVASHPNGMTFFSTSLTIIQNGTVKIPGYDGGKTGFTGQAGRCLEFYAEINGMELVAVVAKSRNDYESLQHLKDSGELMLWTGTTYARYEAEGPYRDITVQYIDSTETVHTYLPFKVEYDVRIAHPPVIEADVPETVEGDFHKQKLKYPVRVVLDDGTVLKEGVIEVVIPKEPELVKRFWKLYGVYIACGIGALALVIVLAAAARPKKKKRKKKNA